MAEKKGELVPVAVTPGNALAVDISTPQGLDVAFRVANALAQSGHFKDARQGAQAFAKIVAGQELGLGPVASMNGIHTIEGKMSPGANLVATLIIRSGVYRFRVVEESPDVCRIRFDEREDGKWEPIGEADFTLEEAKDAGLLGKDNWRKYQRDMLFARALMRGARRYCADVFGGQPVYSPDELGAENVGPDGDLIIDDSTVEATTNQRGEDRYSYLVNVFGAEAVDALLTRKDGTRVQHSALAGDDVYQRAEAKLRADRIIDESTATAAVAEPSEPVEPVEPGEPELAEFEEVPAAQEALAVPPGDPISKNQLTSLILTGREQGLDREVQIEIASAVMGRPVTSRKEITTEFFDRVSDAFREYGGLIQEGKS